MKEWDFLSSLTSEWDVEVREWDPSSSSPSSSLGQGGERSGEVEGGVGVFAKRDFKAGELLFSELPFCSSLLPSSLVRSLFLLIVVVVVVDEDLMKT